MIGAENRRDATQARVSPKLPVELNLDGGTDMSPRCKHPVPTYLLFNVIAIDAVDREMPTYSSAGFRSRLTCRTEETPRNSLGAGKSLPRSGGWNRLLGNSPLIPLMTHADRGRLPGREKPA